MITFPPEVHDFLYHLHLDRHKPAWLLVSADAEVVDSGGHLEHFGLSSTPDIENECPWLIGLLPHDGELLELSMVEIDEQTAFQPSLLPYGDSSTLVVILDMSRELVLRRAAQQVINERSLLGYKRCAEPGLPHSLLAALDTIVLECSNEAFVALGATPQWWTLQSPIQLADLIGFLPLLEHFLSDAEEVWEGEAESLISEVWEQEDGRPLYASAHLVEGRRFLVIRSPGQTYTELRGLIESLHGSE